MRSLSRLTFAVACLAFICISARHTSAQNKVEGRLELQTRSIDLSSRINGVTLRVLGEQLGKHCCPDPKCCDLGFIADLRKYVKSPDELGVLIVPRRGSAVVPLELTIEIYAGKTNNLLFSTEARCSGCGESVSAASENRTTGYLLRLDKKAAAAAKEFFNERNSIRVGFRTRGGRGAPDQVYLVNANSLNH